MKKYSAELLGTFMLVFFGCGAVVTNTATGGAVGLIGIALTFGLVVLALIQALGDVSGAHLNPAVTIGLFVAKRINAATVAPYVIAQCAGAIFAALLLHALFPNDKGLGATLPGASITVTQVFILETVLTFFLMFVILSVTTGAKEKGITAGIAISSVVTLEILFAGPLTGASMNPARSIGPALVSGQLNHIAVYIAAPVIGACLAAFACNALRETAEAAKPEPVAVADQVTH
ncbi:MAG TPA: aquaporin [Planctomycetota bacterium]|nr:aquaporin [Planctomycetota bacterium]